MEEIKNSSEPEALSYFVVALDSVVSASLDVQGEKVLLNVPLVVPLNEHVSDAVHIGGSCLLIQASSNASQNVVHVLVGSEEIWVEKHFWKWHFLNDAVFLVDHGELVYKQGVTDSKGCR